MKCLRITSIAFAACVAVHAAPVIEKPAVMPGAMLSLTVSDVHGLLDEVGTVAAQASPMMNGPMLKSMLGMQLGDPSLAGIAPGKGLAVVMLNPTNTFAMIEVSEAQSAAYANTLKAMGQVTQYNQGVLISASAAAQLSTAAGLVSEVKSTLLAKRSPTLRMAMQPATLVESNKEQIEGLLQTLPVMMGMKQGGAMSQEAVDGVSTVLVAEFRVLLSLAEQVDAAEVVLAPKGGSLRIDEIFATKAGSRLAKLCNAPVVNQWNPKLQSSIFSNGAFKIEMLTENPEACAEFIAAESKSFMTLLELDDSKSKSVSDYLQKSMDLYSGTVCESIFNKADGGMGVGVLMEVKDEAAAFNYYKTMSADLEDFGFNELYQDLGMPIAMEFKENVRKYKGINIHQFGMSFDTEKMLPEQSKQLEAMKMDNMQYELALFDGLMAFSMGGETIETIIDRMKDASYTPEPLKARSVYPVGGFYYSDMDIAEYFKMVSSLMPETPQNPLPMAQLAQMLKGTAPISSAGFQNDGRVLFSATVPGELLSTVGQMAMMMQMQQMQQGGAPQGMPQGMPAGMPQAMPEP